MHLVGCLWFYVGGFAQNFATEWGPVETPSLFDRYTEAVSWALVNLVDKGMASPATKGNRAQYWFMNFVIALGLCVYATIIGSSAAIFSKLDSQQQHRRKQLAALRAFMRRKEIGPGSSLGDRLQEYFDFTVLQGSGAADYDDTAITSQLPNSLLSEVVLHENYSLIHKVCTACRNSESLAIL